MAITRLQRIAALLLVLLLFAGTCIAEEVHFPGETVDVVLEVTDNPAEAVFSLFHLEYDHDALELLPSNAIRNDRSSDMDPYGIKVGKQIPVSFMIKQNAISGSYPVNVIVEQAADINEQLVSGPIYSSPVITIFDGDDQSKWNTEIPDGLKWRDYGDHIVITGYSGDADSVVIPDYINGLPVTEIGENAFSYIGYVSMITIPDTVSTIGNYAFVGCEGLRSIDLPKGVKQIGECCFRFCSKLKKVSIPTSIIKIGKFAFSYCENLQSIQISENHPTFRIENDALIRNSDNCLILYPAAQKRTFYKIPDSVQSIGEGAFTYSKITSIEIPGTVKEIGNDAFANSELEKVSIAEGVSIIGEHAFTNCRLSYIYIPKSIQSIGAASFDCYLLNEIEVSASNQNFRIENNMLIRNADDCLLCYPAGLSESHVAIPSTVRSAADGCFIGAQFRSILIPDSLQTIGDWVFNTCSFLETFVLSEDHPTFCVLNSALVRKNDKMLIATPIGLVNAANRYSISNEVKGIIRTAFANCWDMTELTIPENVSVIENDAFIWINDDCVFHVEKGSYAERYCRNQNLRYDNDMSQIIIGDIEKMEQGIYGWIDVNQEDWFYDAVIFAYEHDLMHPITENYFGAAEDMAIGEMIGSFCNMIGFPDLITAAEIGLEEDGHVNRIEMSITICMLCDCIGFAVDKTVLLEHPDADDRIYLTWAIENGFMAAYEGESAQYECANRADEAQFLSAFYRMQFE